MVSVPWQLESVIGSPTDAEAPGTPQRGFLPSAVTEIILGLDKPANDGSCVGRSDGRVVFCRHGLPGETVRAEVVDGGADSRFWRAEALAVTGEPAAVRVPSPCPGSAPVSAGLQLVARPT